MGNEQPGLSMFYLWCYNYVITFIGSACCEANASKCAGWQQLLWKEQSRTTVMKSRDQQAFLGVWSTGEGLLRGQKVTSFVSGRDCILKWKTTNSWPLQSWKTIKEIHVPLIQLITSKQTVTSSLTFRATLSRYLWDYDEMNFSTGRPTGGALVYMIYHRRMRLTSATQWQVGVVFMKLHKTVTNHYFHRYKYRQSLLYVVRQLRAVRDKQFTINHTAGPTVMVLTNSSKDGNIFHCRQVAIDSAFCMGYSLFVLFKDKVINHINPTVKTVRLRWCYMSFFGVLYRPTVALTRHTKSC